MTAHLPTIPESLLAKPLDYLQADHFRQRAVLNLMMQLADGGGTWQDAAAAAIHYLETALPLHDADEEAALFPLLRQRCLPEDGIDAVITRLHTEHIESHASGKLIAQELGACAAGRKPPSLDLGLAAHLKSFVRLERMHIALENAVLIPLARVRLTTDDLSFLSDCMRRRRLDASAILGGGDGQHR